VIRKGDVASQIGALKSKYSLLNISYIICSVPSNRKKISKSLNFVKV